MPGGGGGAPWCWGLFSPQNRHDWSAVVPLFCCCVAWVHQMGEAVTSMCTLGMFVLFWSLCRASASVMSLLSWLHLRWSRWQLERSYGDPPRDRGMSSSTSPRMGWGWHPAQGGPGHLGPCPPGVIFRVLSTGRSQSAHVCSSALTRLTSSRLRCPLALWSGAAIYYPRRSDANLMSALSHGAGRL